MDFANKVKAKNNFAKEGSPKVVEVLDMMEMISAAKITAWWGHDYVLLSKLENGWTISEVIWQGPLKQ